MTKNASSLWHPFTQHALAGAPVFVERAEGAALYTQDGRRIIDAISSWWVNTHGHNHPAIVKAVQEQAAKLDQVIFAGFTHEPAEKLARKLTQIFPASLKHVFLSDSGSTAVEVALKMAIGAHAHKGQPRRTIVALEHGYHGDTFGAMSVGSPSVFNEIYEPWLFTPERLPFPAKDKEHLTLEAFKKLLEARGDDIAALILEPLVLGAGGMLMYSAHILKELKNLCDEYGIYFIADEVMTGFGRTGTLTACEQANITPDIMCLSKGLTGGFLPLGATLCTAEIYDTFYSTDRTKTFWHSSSYTGNPLACAAAVASLELWEQPETQQRIKNLCDAQEKHLQSLAAENPRRCGTIVAFDIKQSDAGYLSAIGPQLYEFFLKSGVLLRPLGNTLYVMPPYCVSETDLENVYVSIHRALDALRRGNLERAA